MGLYLLKYPYRKILLPLAKKMKWLNPDYLGYLATFIALLTMFCYLYGSRYPFLLLLSIFLTFVRMTLNTIDGVIAIERGNLKLKGEIVNALPDRYSDIFIMLGIGLSEFCNPILGMIGLASVYTVSYTGMLGKAVGVHWQHQGPLGKVERLIIIMIFSLLQYLAIRGIIGNLFSLSWFENMMILFIIFSQITVYYRLKGQLRECWKLDWIKYRPSDQKYLVIYDTITGNTKAVADQIADSLSCPVFNIRERTEDEFLSLDFTQYNAVIWATPNIRKHPTELLSKRLVQMKEKLDNEGYFLPKYALAITSGMPVWRWYSAYRVVCAIKTILGQKPLAVLHIKGFHAKYKTYRHHPNEYDLETSWLFGMKVCEKCNGHPGFFKQWQIFLLRIAIHTLGQWSNGIHLATREGFTSGKMLEYIYANQTQGRFLLGKYFDHLFLHNEGWEDVRKRKNNLVDVLVHAVNIILEKKTTIRLGDIASGPADYILELLDKYKDKDLYKDKDISAELRDMDSRWLEDAKKKAQKLGIADKITVKQANALKESDFVFNPIPDIFVSSGFYDWFENDEDVIKSMQLIYDVLPEGGLFAFTNQSEHVDLTLINAVFIDFNHQQLKMKVRKAKLVNSWAERIGFKILMTKTDSKQRYSVTLAQK